MALFGKPKYSTVTAVKKREIPPDVFTKCPVSGEVVYTKELENNFKVVPKSGYHFQLTAHERIKLLLDGNSFEERDIDLEGKDALSFNGYPTKLLENRQKTGLTEAVITGVGRMGGVILSVAVMDFRFMGASMGCAVGEKITRAVERATELESPLVIVCASGGARMQEGILSLMQMAKVSAALARLASIAQPYIAILTDPTMAGVIASFASLGDIIIAEPGARIGFAGARVIRETTNQELPPGFQTAEFLLAHGFLDQIVHRSQMRRCVINFLKAFNGRSKLKLVPRQDILN
ncbi:MAG: acetyl-CoA carboxylase, carboxyltransferase subunit beta [Puniceicoccales bacterium]|jgi:acetyl-CoA carboxylase carboxyl transferase subunit beta|nr:acetyl-CoA carboxylase, carboxyltransferase subunit beta [Puniceicoccales bacterium]